MSSVDGLQVLERYGVVILPALVIAEQIGVPLPAVPALLTIGALAAQGRVSVFPIVAAMAAVALAVDLTWYTLGRKRGASVLARLCRLSLEPDSCVRQAERAFMRFGVRAMLGAKFVPGLTTLLPPLAGVFGARLDRFVLYDLCGVVLWAGWWLALGYVFSDAISVVIARATQFGHAFGAAVAVVLGGYILLKYVRRRLFIRRLRIARIAVDELRRRLDAGEDVSIIDVRSALDVEATPYAIPGSHWLAPEAIDPRDAELFKGRDVVLYCT